VFAEAKRLGATLIQVNHPYDPGEGYFASLDRGVAVGGLDTDFDFLEINGAQADKDDKTLASAWGYWNKGRHVYLTAGSDTHDVWNETSGDARVYAHVEGPLTVAGFLAGLKRGRAFVTHGPLVFPDHMFGETVKLRAGEGAVLGFELDAIAGLKQATIISQGKTVAKVAYAGETRAHLTVPANGSSPGWYALTVEDAAGKKAYTNPIWIEAVP
jgi:hypothetical protein